MVSTIELMVLHRLQLMGAINGTSRGNSTEMVVLRSTRLGSSVGINMVRNTGKMAQHMFEVGISTGSSMESSTALMDLRSKAPMVAGYGRINLVGDIDLMVLRFGQRGVNSSGG